MKKSLLIIFFLCLSSAYVAAEDQENKTMSLNISPHLGKILYLNTEYTSLFKLEIKDKKPCTPKDTAEVFYNISKNDVAVKEGSFSKEIGCTSSASTGEFTPSETGNYTLCGMIINSSVFFSQNLSCQEFEVIDTSNLICDIQLQLKANQTLFYENGQSLEFKPELNNKSFPFVIEYWIEDLFGGIAKPKINTTNTNEKSWKTNIQEQDRVLLLKAIVYPSCDDINISDNAAEKMFIVTKDEIETSPSQTEETAAAESAISILKISPELVSFGEILDAELEIYKGATDKYSVSVWVEKKGKTISEKTKVHLKNKNTLYKFTIPILIDSNCNQKIKDGDAQLIVEGLGLQEEKEFSLEGINEKLCPDTGSLKTEKSTAKEDIEQQTEKTKAVNQSISLFSRSNDLQPSLDTEKAHEKEVAGYEGIVVYESVSERSKNLISWVLFIAFGLLSLVLIIKIG